MKVVYKTYRLLDENEQKLLSKIGDGNIIRLFDKTPYPTNSNDIVCPHFMELACISGCYFNCVYCYAHGTFRFWQKENGRVPVHIKKIAEINSAIETFLRLDIDGMILNTSELADGLAGEGNQFNGKPLSQFLLEKFKGSRHKILFLTKATNIQNFLTNFWQKNAILSWSLNAYPVAERWEKLAPSVPDRIVAARKAYESGYEVRIRIDPMVAIENYQEHYRRLIDDVFHEFTPSRITLGCLRGLTSTIARAVDKSWVPYLTERSNWGLKPPIESRLKMYSTIIEHLKDKYKYRNVAVCKDTLAIWAMLKTRFGLDFRKILCNCIT